MAMPPAPLKAPSKKGRLALGVSRATLPGVGAARLSASSACRTRARRTGAARSYERSRRIATRTCCKSLSSARHSAQCSRCLSMSALDTASSSLSKKAWTRRASAHCTRLSLSLLEPAVLQRRARACQARHHSAYRHVDYRCDLRIVHFFHLAQHQDGALLFRQRLQQCIQSALLITQDGFA